ncbi:MAG: PAS domain S-box-containing protein [Gammaproteobacteria bacterium]|jgi:PAS domain S-box-containing protein
MKSAPKLDVKQDRAQQYLDIADVILVAMNRVGEVTLINRKGCEVLGYKENEILGKNWLQHFLPDALSKVVKSKFNKIIAGDLSKAKRYENPILTSTG